MDEIKWSEEVDEIKWNGNEGGWKKWREMKVDEIKWSEMEVD